MPMVPLVVALLLTAPAPQSSQAQSGPASTLQLPPAQLKHLFELGRAVALAKAEVQAMIPAPTCLLAVPAGLADPKVDSRMLKPVPTDKQFTIRTIQPPPCWRAPRER